MDSQQTSVEQNALEEASSAVQEVPTTPEETIVSIPATQDLKSSDIWNRESDVVEHTAGPITSVETKTYSQSVEDTIVSDTTQFSIIVLAETGEHRS